MPPERPRVVRVVEYSRPVRPGPSGGQLRVAVFGDLTAVHGEEGKNARRWQFGQLCRGPRLRQVELGEKGERFAAAVRRPGNAFRQVRTAADLAPAEGEFGFAGPFRPEQQRWSAVFPFPGTGALNRVCVHPSIVDFAERALDNTDIRPFTTLLDVGGNDLRVGISVNNNPTVQDPYNSSFAWGFPYVKSVVVPTPAASPVLTGAFAANSVTIR